jgi:hypothetical protein
MTTLQFAAGLPWWRRLGGGVRFWFIVVLASVAVILVVVFVPGLRRRITEAFERLQHLLRTDPGAALALVVAAGFFLSLLPMRAHLAEEALAHAVASADGKPGDTAVFEVAWIDVAYGSIQLFTANMPPITASDPSFQLRLARTLAPLIFVLWILAAFSRVARSFFTRLALRFYSGHVVVCGPPDRIIELVNQTKGYLGFPAAQIVAVTDAPVDAAVEKALTSLRARVISVVPFSSAGAFANAVSRASEVLIDFDDAEVTFTFAETAMAVGQRHSHRPGGRTGRWSGRLRPLRNLPAEQVRAFVPFSVSCEFLAAVGADERFRVESRLGSLPRAAFESSTVQRATPSSPLRLLVITDNPDFFARVEIFRCAFRQAEHGLVDVLLVGKRTESVPASQAQTTDWLRVRKATGKGDTTFALQSLIEGRCIEEEQRPTVLPSAPVFVCMDVYRALNVLVEIERLWPERGVPPLSIKYAQPPRANSSAASGKRAVLANVTKVLSASIEVIEAEPARLLAAAPVPHSGVIRGLERHLALWDAHPQPSTLGFRPEHPLLADAPHEFVQRVIEGLETMGLEGVRFEDAALHEHVLGLGPLDLFQLLAHVVEGSVEVEDSSVEALERRGALLDLLSRVPVWMAEGGFVLQQSAVTSPDTTGRSPVFRFSDDELRRMAVETHIAYLETREKAHGSEVGDRRALTAWDQLAYEYQESNLAQVRHLPVKLALLGFDIERLPGGSNWRSDPQWPVPEKSALARYFSALERLEHARWSIERVAAGYVHGAQRQDIAGGGALTHPDLVPYDELGPKDQALDESVVASIPRLLAVVGLRLVPMTDSGRPR